MVHTPRIVQLEGSAVNKGTGRRRSYDTRDAGYRYSAVKKQLGLPKVIRYKRMYELPNLLPLDQGQTPRCVGYSLATVLVAGPVLQPSIAFPQDAVNLADRIYHRAQELDEWPGENEDEGTSVRAGMDAGREFGLVGSYLWGHTVDEIADFLLHHGPVQFGTAWTDGMCTTTPQGWIEVEDAQLNARDVEGHAWAGTGVDVRLKCPDGSRGAVRMEQTWGRGVFGVEGTGRAWVSFMTLAKLMAVGGECAMPVELKVKPA